VFVKEEEKEKEEKGKKKIRDKPSRAKYRPQGHPY
jgi:hypothetical protein